MEHSLETEEGNPKKHGFDKKMSFIRRANYNSKTVKMSTPQVKDLLSKNRKKPKLIMSNTNLPNPMLTKQTIETENAGPRMAIFNPLSMSQNDPVIRRQNRRMTLQKSSIVCKDKNKGITLSNVSVQPQSEKKSKFSSYKRSNSISQFTIEENPNVYKVKKEDVAFLEKQRKGHFFSTKVFNHIKTTIIKTLPGLKDNGFEKVNDEAVLRMKEVFKYKDCNIFGIFTGHGPDGHIISRYLISYFKEAFLNNQTLSTCKNIIELYQAFTANEYEVLTNAFLIADKEMKRHSLEFNPYNSGSSCLLLIQIGNKIISANVGDSRALMLKNKYDLIALSIDHRPNNEEEKTRIVQNGGKIVKENKTSLYKIYKEDKDYPGLTISRTLGDLDAKSLGIISDPTIREFTLIDGNYKYIVMASQGVWKYLSNETVAKIGEKYYSNNLNEDFCDHIIDQVIEASELKGQNRDDVTVIIIFL